MIHLIFYAAAAAVTGITAALIGASLAKDVQQCVARWLRKHGLSQSKLMDAVIFLDMIGAVIRARVKVVTREQAPEVIQIERSYAESDIKYPEVLAELRRSRHATLNVMSLFPSS
jgi:hypothetical protein